MKSKRLQVTTGDKRCIRDLSRDVNGFAAGEGDGLVHIFVPHATAGLVVMELGAGSEQDLWDRLDALLPRDHRYVHQHGAPGHGRDHVLPAFLSPSLSLPVIKGKPALGTWQSIALVDPNIDNPEREVLLTFHPAGD